MDATRAGRWAVKAFIVGDIVLVLVGLWCCCEAELLDSPCVSVRVDWS
jgi:hypothetical protein